MLRPGLLILTVTLTACSTVDSGALPETNASQTDGTGAPATTGDGAPTSTDASGPQSGTINDESLSNTATTGPSGTGEDTGSTTGAAALDYDMSGPHPVGNTRFTLTVGDRDLLVELWYPADVSAAADAAQGHPIADFVPAGPDHDALVEGCSPTSRPPARSARASRHPRRSTHRPPRAGPYPLIVFSHCHNCVRFSAFTSPSGWPATASSSRPRPHRQHPVRPAQRRQRRDRRGVPGRPRRRPRGRPRRVLAAGRTRSPPRCAASRPRPRRRLGHSYGAATTGRVAQDDPRVKAALPIAAPIENPVFPGTQVADIHVPMLIDPRRGGQQHPAIGNNLIELNFMNANPPVRLLRVKDAGHWNFTDICGLVADFSAGCGEGERQTEPGVQFTYLDIDIGREIASAYSLAFFDRYLRDNPDADDFLDAATPDRQFVTVDVRE
jgi:hypothetical protein